MIRKGTRSTCGSRNSDSSIATLQLANVNRRAEILRELARFETPTEPLLRELQLFGWDWSDAPLLVLTKLDFLHVIDRLLAGEIMASQLQEWAENLEMREDVAFDEKDKELLFEILFRIATPDINEPLTQNVVQRMRDEITRVD